MVKHGLISFFLFLTVSGFSQLFLARDTVTVIEAGRVLKMPWANGINFSNVSSIDLDFDGKKDVVVFDRVNRYGVGRFKCFINTGNPGEINYKAAPDLSYTFPAVSNWAVFLDYNCDSLPDLFCSTSLGIMVYKNTSTPNHTPSFTLVKPLLSCDYNPGGPPFMANLYASTIGVPGIADVDNDGDLDILSFSPQGVFIELYQNMSKEKYNTCDSLVFEYGNYCWGKLSESSCEVEFNACGTSSRMASQGQRTEHAGSCLTCLDTDGDQDQDIILGDISCSFVQYIYNSGTPGNLGALFSDTTKLYPNYPNKNSTTQIRLNSFPCTYVTDVNNDNKPDLIATPNVPSGENYKSMWYYRNSSTTNTMSFEFVKNNFLQDEMIEVGQNSFPAVFDYNNDGLKDLLIGNDGYYTNDTLITQLTLYQNIGSPSQPSYSLITRDYASLAHYRLNSAMPTVGDIDNDGDIDICLGTSSGQIHWLENTAGANHVCNFSLFHNNPFMFTTFSAEAAPQLFDIDSDGKLDLIIGTQNGNLAYYKNIGTASVPAFSLITNTFGNVDVKDPNNLTFGIDGYAVPFLYKDGADTKALIGTVYGDIYQYAVPTNTANSFILYTPRVNAYNEGAQSAVCFEDVNNDGRRDLFIGNASGGLSFFSSMGPDVGIREFSAAAVKNAVLLFPNPTENILNITIDKINFSAGKIIITDVIGKEMIRQALHSDSETISLQALQPGIYFATVSLEVNSQLITTTQKIIKNN